MRDVYFFHSENESMPFALDKLSVKFHKWNQMAEPIWKLHELVGDFYNEYFKPDRIIPYMAIINDGENTARVFSILNLNKEKSMIYTNTFCFYKHLLTNNFNRFHPLMNSNRDICFYGYMDNISVIKTDASNKHFKNKYLCFFWGMEYASKKYGLYLLEGDESDSLCFKKPVRIIKNIDIGDRFSMYYSAKEQMFHLYFRKTNAGNITRKIYYMHSRDLVTWRSDEYDVNTPVLERTTKDEDGFQPYSLLRCDSLPNNLVFIESYNHITDTVNTEYGIEKYYSHSFTRINQKALDNEQYWNKKWCFPLTGDIITMGRYNMMLYSARANGHEYIPDIMRNEYIGVACIERNCFTSLEAGDEEGYVLFRINNQKENSKLYIKFSKHGIIKNIQDLYFKIVYDKNKKIPEKFCTLKNVNFNDGLNAYEVVLNKRSQYLPKGDLQFMVLLRNCNLHYVMVSDENPEVV